MEDYIVRATAANAQIRAFAVTSRALVEQAREIHDLSPVITAALGRLLTAGAMMGSMLKGEKDVLTLQIHCGGRARSCGDSRRKGKRKGDGAGTAGNAAAKCNRKA